MQILEDTPLKYSTWNHATKLITATCIVKGIQP